ncbi:hypothetical protein GF351_06330, partial [Candidatus Woesearchaeota archaeon]|nr:hypothetical protein [Candidatus Woesearchaeota archaeon]
MRKIVLSLMVMCFMVVFGAVDAAGMAIITECGGTDPCECGDKLIADRILDENDALTGCTSTALKIQTPGLTLDCNGSQITGTSANSNNGVHIQSGDVNVKNCEISSFGIGIRIDEGSGDNIVIQDSDLHGNCMGLYLNNGNTAEVNGVDFSNNGPGALADVDCSDITGGFPGGIVAEGSSGNVVNGNFVGNENGMYDIVGLTINWEVTEPVNCTNNPIHIYGNLTGAENINKDNCSIYLEGVKV